MPYRYQVDGSLRLWNISKDVGLGTNASPNDVKFVQFLLNVASTLLVQDGLMDEIWTIPQTGMVHARTAAGIYLYQEKFMAHKTLDAMVSTIKNHDHTYGGSGTFTLAHLQRSYAKVYRSIQSSGTQYSDPLSDNDFNAAMDGLMQDAGLDIGVRTEMMNNS